MNSYQILEFIISLSAMIAVFLGIITIAFLRIYIIRKIEKRLGRKLIFTSPVTLVNPLFGCALEVALYITVKYLQAEFYKKSLPHFKYYNFNNFALNHVDYSIQEASGSEIFFSIFLMFCFFVFAIFSLMLIFLPNQHM